ncbi:MAG: tRNA pseudouridine13 synthase [Patescibacteria group bacterium]|jgi:tRNA pseudouridine13 synthase
MARYLDKIPVKFKTLCEDFIVEEIGEEWQCEISPVEHFGEKPDLSKLPKETIREFLLCELEKKDIDQFRARRELASELRKGTDALGIAGTKDKKAVTSQRISIFQPDMDKIEHFHHPHMYLKNFKWGKRKIKLGYLDGNKFTVVLRDLEKKQSTKVGNAMRKDTSFANLFGKQRFGSVRGNNARIGFLIVKKKFKEAIDAILTDITQTEREETTAARKRLSEELEKNKKDPLVAYKDAIEYFPMYLRMERGLMYTLLENKCDYIKAIRRGDKKQFLMFVHALQSKMFNEITEAALADGISFKEHGQQRVPLFGYKSKIDEDKLGEIEEKILINNKISMHDFRIDDLKFLSLKGEYRRALIDVKDINIEIDDDELNEGAKKITAKFSLPSGVYATTFLSNFFVLNEVKD